MGGRMLSNKLQFTRNKSQFQEEKIYNFDNSHLKQRIKGEREKKRLLFDINELEES